jgi:hypothetical protein
MSGGPSFQRPQHDPFDPYESNGIDPYAIEPIDPYADHGIDPYATENEESDE